MKETTPSGLGKDIKRLGVFIASEIGDVETTFYGLQHVDGFIEKNPFAKDLFSQRGETGAVLEKMAIVLLVSGCYLLSKKLDKNFENRKFGMKNALMVSTFFQLAVDFHNLANLFVPLPF